MAKSKKLNGDEKKTLAYELYMSTDKTQAEIAEIIDVTPKTLSKWKHDGLWDELRAAQSISAAEIERNIYARLAEMTRGDKPMNADAMLKLTKSLEVITEKRYTVAQAMNVFQAFTSFLFGKDVDLAKAVNKYQKEFIDDLINR